MNPWDSWHQSHEGAKYPAEDLVRWVASLEPRSTVLEVGCGNGSNLVFLMAEGHKTFGIDTSEAAVRKAKARTGLQFNHALPRDARDMVFDASTFDAVIDNECLYTLSFEDARKAYLECLRVLKPGGKMFIRHFAPGTWEGAMVKDTSYRFSPEWEMRLLLNGFEIDQFEMISRTVNGMQERINEWIVWARKPTSSPS